MARQSVRITWDGRTARRALARATPRGLRLAAEHLLQVSRTQVPLEEGTLERSGEAMVDKRKLEAAVSFSTPYAVRQHEDLTLRHDGGRKGKYLEDPMHSERPTMLDLIAAEARKGLD